MLLRLAACLDVPLRDRNEMLTAAGYQALFLERGFTEPAFDLVRRDVEAMLMAQDPNPAMAIDRHWVMLTANRAVAHFVAGAEPILLRPPVNLLRLFLHPAGLAPRIVNLTQWRAHLIVRLRRHLDICGDGKLADLLEEIRDYPAPRDAGRREELPEPGALAVPLRLATIDGVLSFLGTTTMFAAPSEITLAELSIEAFLPGDAVTAEIMRNRLGMETGAAAD
jgi:hypothetical protein